MKTMLLAPFAAAVFSFLISFALAEQNVAKVASEKSESVAVKIDNFTFNPAEITVPAGTTVTWKNADDIPHAVAAVDQAFRSKAMDTDEEYSFTFEKPGAYEYFCSIHPHMKGKVIVK